MNPDKKNAITELLQDMVMASMDLGAAQQRHMDAAKDENNALETVRHIGGEILELLEKTPNPNTRKDRN